MKIQIKVIPNSKKEEVLSAGERQLLVRVKEKAEKQEKEPKTLRELLGEI